MDRYRQHVMIELLLGVLYKIVIVLYKIELYKIVIVIQVLFKWIWYESDIWAWIKKTLSVTFTHYYDI